MESALAGDGAEGTVLSDEEANEVYVKLDGPRHGQNATTIAAAAATAPTAITATPPPPPSIFAVTATAATPRTYLYHCLF